MTLQDFQGFIAWAITNNKTGIISNLNQKGYNTPMNISDKDLYDKLMGIFSTYGLSEIQNVLTGVSIDYNKVTPQDVQSIAATTGAQTQTVNPKGVSTNTIWDDISKFLGGSSVTTGASSSTTTSPAINQGVVAGLVVLVLLVMIWVYKS